MITKQARAQPPIGGESHPVAALAIRVGHRRDDSDRTSGIRITEVHSGTVPALRSGIGLNHVNRTDARQHFICRNHMVEGEFAQLTNGHELDKTHMPGIVPRQRCEVGNFVVVDSAHHDHVDLDRAKSGRLCGSRRGNQIEVEITPGDLHHPLGAQRIGADVDAIKAGIREFRGHGRQLHTIRRERDILDFRDVAQHPYESAKLRPDSRFATRDAKPSQAHRGELTHNFGDLLVP